MTAKLLNGVRFSGAALGPLLTGVLSTYGWQNVFYMLIGADICAFLVSVYIFYANDRQKAQSLASGTCGRCIPPASRIVFKPNCCRVTMVTWLAFAFFLFVVVFFTFVVFGDSRPSE